MYTGRLSESKCMYVSASVNVFEYHTCTMIGGTILARRRHPPVDVARRFALALLCWSGEARPPPTLCI